MSDPILDVANKALALDPADRLRLASLLLDSVETPAEAGWKEAWDEELARRSAAADGRCVRGASWDAVRSRLLTELAGK